MAKRRIDQTYQEVESVRSRWVYPHQMAYLSEVNQRLVDLSHLIGTDLGEEPHRHVVVSSIAALETYHRGMIASIVNSGDKYINRAADSVSEKILMKDALKWVSGETVTFGEVFAHTVPFNNVTDLISSLADLLNCDMHQALGNAIDPYDLRNRKASPGRLVENVDGLLKSLGEAFELRHIFAHETASTIKVDAEKCRELLSAVRKWIEASNAVLWVTAYRDMPLTQLEMNKHAESKLREARNELANAMRETLLIARKMGVASWLRKNHFAWMNMTKDLCDHAYFSRQGTMWPAIGGNRLSSAILARVDQIKALVF